MRSALYKDVDPSERLVLLSKFFLIGIGIGQRSAKRYFLINLLRDLKTFLQRLQVTRRSCYLEVGNLRVGVLGDSLVEIAIVSKGGRGLGDNNTQASRLRRKSCRIARNWAIMSSLTSGLILLYHESIPRSKAAQSVSFILKN